MTYLSPFAGVVPVTSTQPGYKPTATERYSPIGLGVYDVAALQHLYGANMHHKWGNGTYSFDSHIPVFATIWNAGGNDTLLQLGNLGAVIDLRGGEHMSRMGLFTSYSATYSKSALAATFAIDGLTNSINELYGVYTDDYGVAHGVGVVRSFYDNYTYYTDPYNPISNNVSIDVDLISFFGNEPYTKLPSEALHRNIANVKI